MKVTRNWLKEYVDFDWSTEELAERLTMLGVEVEGIDKVGGEFEGIVVAQVVTRDRHPNADKLSVCRVNDGRGERQIVCGAQNFQAGDKVPLILPGASLPPKPGDKEPFTIKVGKIRGVESHGMMCSADELGLDPEALGLKKEDGLLILPGTASVGQPFAAFLGRAGSDVVYDLEVTPNRPDLNSLIGIAREIAALTGNPLRLPAIDGLEARMGGAPVGQQVSVRLEAPDACARYVARVIRGVSIGPSPDWLRSALEKVGLRSINNVVDVTNFVMLESGQPLHAFDYHLLARDADGRPAIVVRPARDGEPFVTLDGREHVLGPDRLLIADPDKGIALAGVMGGRNTEIQPSTVDVLLESAWFSPTNIRRTSKALALRTDSSYRFERGADLGATEWASRRAAQLILQTAGGTLAPGVVDAYPAPPAPKRVPLRYRKVNELLGLDLGSDQIAAYLLALGLRQVEGDEPGEPGQAMFEVPSFRVDLKRETDLIEEVARLYGVDRLPATEPRQAKGAHPFDARHDELMEVRRILAALGLDEAQGQTLISRASVPEGAAGDLVALANPLSSDMDVLRPSLIPGLLDILGHNLRRRNGDVALFEIGRVFRRAGNEVKESWRLAFALTGARHPAFWSGTDRGVTRDVHDLKGLLEEFFEHLGLRGILFARRPDPVGWWVESAQITHGGKVTLGEIGQLHPRLAKKYDLRDVAVLAELNLDQVLARRNPARSFKPLPAYPAVERDLAMQVAESVTHDAVLQAVRQAKAPNLEGAELFDVFRGAGLGAGQKSVAYRFTYRAVDRTLTDAEVTAAHDRVVAQLKQSLGVEVR